MGNKLIFLAVASFFICLFSAEKTQVYKWFCGQGTWKTVKIDNKQCFNHSFDEEGFLPSAPISLIHSEKLSLLKSIDFSVKSSVLLEKISFGISFKSDNRIIDIIFEGNINSIDTILTYNRTNNITEILSIDKMETGSSIQTDTLWHDVTFSFEKDEIKIYYDDIFVAEIHPIISLEQNLNCGIATLSGMTYFRDIVIKGGSTTIKPKIEKETIFHFHMGEESQNRSGGYFGPIH